MLFTIYVVVNTIIQPSRLANERRAMCEMIDRYNDTSAIFIADRGYENYNIFAHVEHKGMYYLIRVKDITSNGITSKLTMLPESGDFDEWVNVTLTKKQTLFSRIEICLRTNTFSFKETRIYYARNIVKNDSV